MSRLTKFVAPALVSAALLTPVACSAPQNLKPVAPRETMDQAGAYHGDRSLAFRALNILHSGRFAEEPQVGPLTQNAASPEVAVYAVYTAIDPSLGVREGAAESIDRGNERLAGWIRTVASTNGTKQSLFYDTGWNQIAYVDNAGVLNVGGVLPFGNATLTLKEASLEVYAVRSYLGMDSRTYDVGTVLASRVAGAKLPSNPNVKRADTGSAAARGIAARQQPAVVFVKPLSKDLMPGVIAKLSKESQEKLDALRAADLKSRWTGPGGMPIQQ
jgi:hypothetical protein